LTRATFGGPPPPGAAVLPFSFRVGGDIKRDCKDMKSPSLIASKRAVCVVLWICWASATSEDDFGPVLLAVVVDCCRVRVPSLDVIVCAAGREERSEESFE